jgi:hypothetical protein
MSNKWRELSPQISLSWSPNPLAIKRAIIGTPEEGLESSVLNERIVTEFEGNKSNEAYQKSSRDRNDEQPYINSLSLCG